MGTATKAKQPKNLLTAHDVAEMLNVSLRSVWTWAASGRLKARKIGPKATRFKREDVERLIERGK